MTSQTSLAGLGAIAFMLAFALSPRDAQAVSTLRLRSSGSVCSEADTTARYEVGAPVGLKGFFVGTNQPPVTTCPIPLGDQVVNVWDSAPHTLYKVQVRMYLFASTQRYVSAWLFLHDLGSGDYCTCDGISLSTDPNTYFTYEVYRDGIYGLNCGGCNNDHPGWEAWACGVQASMSGADGEYIIVKAISVYDNEP